jgi:hypothetical protein
MAVTKKFTSPKGEIEWATIEGEGKENLSGVLQYVANSVISADDPVVAEIEAFWEENKPKGFRKERKSNGLYPYKIKTEEKDEDGKDIYEVDETRLSMAFKTGTTYPDGSPKKIQIYNSKANKVELPDGVKIGNSTIGQISGAMGIYTTMDPKGKTIIDAGITLYLNSIKISKLVEYEGDGDNYEPDDEDDEDGGWTGDEGWEGEEKAAPAPQGKKLRL